MIDNKLTQQIGQWLNLPEKKTDEQIFEGALLLLRLNRNRILYNNILARPQRHLSKLVYELKKFYKIRLDGLTMEEVKELDSTITPATKAAIEVEPKDDNGEIVNVEDLPAHGGKRKDHDLLPVEIQAIWTNNAERWKKIKQLYNTLLNIEKPCDRYEYLKQEKDLWYAYKEDFAKYDSYKIEDENSTGTSDAGKESPTAKDVTNARSYISKNLDDLLSLKAATSVTSSDGSEEKAKADYASKLSKVQERVQLLLTANEEIGEDLRAKLKEAGVVFPEENNSQDNEQGKKN